MRIEHIKEFVVFCRYMNFTRAAKELFITQPSLSNHIAALEKELGFTLVDRGTEPKTLTPAGEVVLSRASDLLDDYNALIHELNLVTKDPEETLVLEHPICSSGAATELNLVLARFLSEKPSVTLRRTRYSTTPLWDVLSSGMADLGLIWQPTKGGLELDGRRFACIPVPGGSVSATMAWVHRDNPLFAKEELCAEDLNGQRLVLPSNPEYTVYSKQVLKALKRCGVKARAVYKAGDYLDVCATIKDDEILLSDACDTSSAMFAIASNRAFKPIRGDELSCVPCFVYAKGNPNPVLADFVSFLREA